MSVCLEECDSHWKDFRENSYLQFLLNYMDFPICVRIRQKLQTLYKKPIRKSMTSFHDWSLYLRQCSMRGTGWKWRKVTFTLTDLDFLETKVPPITIQHNSEIYAHKWSVNTICTKVIGFKNLRHGCSQNAYDITVSKCSFPSLSPLFSPIHV
jgi:hypothetical protein